MRKGIHTKGHPKVSPTILIQLSKGLLESNNFQEVFAIDFATLFYSIAPTVSTDDIKLIKDSNSDGILKRMKVSAKILSEYFTFTNLATLKKHPSDTVRGWVAFIIGMGKELSLEQKLYEVRSLASDSHFAVREWSWLALRESITQDIHSSIKLLLPWALSATTNIRRFAIESTRPRGVWSKHIPELKTFPKAGSSLLDTVMEDPSLYVQNSCGNWLSDAAKSNPEWVVEFCETWERRSKHPSTSKIIKRGLRNLL